MPRTPRNPESRGGPDRDTIAAIATPAGQGGVGIVRISGSHAIPILSAICGRETAPRVATVARFFDAAGQQIDHGLALVFPGPHSFTGEDVAELHGHGGPVVMDMLLKSALDLGARVARPGEFSERAFLNGKIDLAQAEAVADLIASRSQAAARSALRSLSGDFSTRVNTLARDMLDLRIFVEGAIDFPEDDIDFLREGRVEQRLERVVGSLKQLLKTATQGAILTEGITLVLAGRPNVGKSSLLNRLLGFERAIVTSTPGTTRDVLVEALTLDGVPVRIVDTAGLRESTDEIELEGMRRARQQIAEAERVLLVQDAQVRESPDELVTEQGLPTDRLTVVINKVDLSGEPPGEVAGSAPPEIRVSAKTGAGIDALKRHVLAAVGYRDEAGVFSARRRHLDALRLALDLLELGAATFRDAGAGELLAEDLRRSHEKLGEIVGSVSSDALLGEIFARFCIGK